MIKRDEFLKASDVFYNLFDQIIDTVFGVDYEREYYENDIKLCKKGSELHISFGEKVVLMINFWEQDSKSLDIIYEDGQWMLEPNEYWKEYDKVIEIDEHFIEEILEKFNIIADEFKEGRTT